MVLASKLVDQTRGYLQTSTSDEDQSSTLVSMLASDGLTFTVNPARGLSTAMSAGLIEIGAELIWVDGIAADGTCTVPPWGRGFKSTVATAHNVGDRIVSQPRYPRQSILDELNIAIGRVFPDVFVVKHYNTFTTQPSITYDVPNDFQWELKVEWQLPDGRNYWRTVTYTRSNAGGRATTAGGNNPDQGTTLDIGEPMLVGMPLHIEYAAQPLPLTAETDDFTAVTGLGTNLTDVVCLGAAANLITANEAQRAQLGTVEQQARGQYVQPGTSMNVSKYLEQRYAQRLKEERQALQLLYPVTMQRVWIH
jgi:hypothetical protein